MCGLVRDRRGQHEFLINLPSTNSAAQGRAERWEWADAVSTDQLASARPTAIWLARAVDKLPLTNSAAQGRAERGAVIRLDGCFLVGERFYRE